jgi:hypothetical protein
MSTFAERVRKKQKRENIAHIVAASAIGLSVLAAGTYHGYNKYQAYRQGRANVTGNYGPATHTPDYQNYSMPE